MIYDSFKKIPALVICLRRESRELVKKKVFIKFLKKYIIYELKKVPFATSLIKIKIISLNLKRLVYDFKKYNTSNWFRLICGAWFLGVNHIKDT